MIVKHPKDAIAKIIKRRLLRFITPVSSSVRVSHLLVSSRFFSTSLFHMMHKIKKPSQGIEILRGLDLAPSGKVWPCFSPVRCYSLKTLRGKGNLLSICVAYESNLLSLVQRE
jgi:hypothetical protein